MIHQLSIIQAMCPAHSHYTLFTYWSISVTLVLCLMMVQQILSFSLTFISFLSMAHWLVSSFFTNAFVRDHVWHPHANAGKTHWLKTSHFRLMGRCLSIKMSLYFPKTLHPACILIDTSCLVLFSTAIVFPRYLSSVTLSISVQSTYMLSLCQYLPLISGGEGG